MSGYVRHFRTLGLSFVLLWVGETVSGFGGALMQFAIGVWVFQKSGSPQQFAVSFLSGTVPALLLMPWSGTLADHFDRRWVLIVTDIFACLIAAALGLLLVTGQLTVLHLYVFGALGSVLGSIRAPSYQAAVSAVLPQDSLTRASGITGLSRGIMQLVSPVLAGALIASSGIGAIVAIQLSSMPLGALMVLSAFARSKNAFAHRRNTERPALLRGMLTGLGAGLAFFQKERLMMNLLLYVLIQEGLLTLASGMLTPLILSTHSSATLGLVTSCGAAGGIIGSLVLVLVNTQRRLMSWLLIFNAGLSLCVVTAGIYTSAAVWCACAFAALLAGSVSGGFGTALWMRKTPEASRGSIFALLALSHLIVTSLVMVLGGVVSEHLLEPALALGGPWQHSVGQFLGAGKGRGIGFLFVSSGSLCMLISLAALAGSELRRLDELVSDSPAAVAET
jgi:diaminobutyrate-2-oxoglutarate transaminase